MSAFDFRGRVAVITGGTSGIGRAAVQQFRAAGAQIVLTGQDPSRVATAQRELPDVLAVGADARRVEDAVALSRQIRTQHGRVDALFFNAGIFSFRPLGDLTEEYVDDMIGTNLKGLLCTLKELTPLISVPLLIASRLRHRVRLAC
jgi:NAD(P)-dependent dehydrogenase (short-subunit alcohol dehydrogenase family)